MELKLPPPPTPLLPTQLSLLSISPPSTHDPINSTSSSSQLESSLLSLTPHQNELDQEIRYTRYKGEIEIPTIMNLVDKELSEPYNFYTYRYFLKDWPHLCFMAYSGDQAIGTIVCKQELHREKLNRGYLAMLSTSHEFRGRGVATNLVKLAITKMYSLGCEEVVLETEIDNLIALGFYKKLGFIKEKRMFRFYLNAKDAFRLFLPLPIPISIRGGREGGDEVGEQGEGEGEGGMRE